MSTTLENKVSFIFNLLILAQPKHGAYGYARRSCWSLEIFLNRIPQRSQIAWSGGEASRITVSPLLSFHVQQCQPIRQSRFPTRRFILSKNRRRLFVAVIVFSSFSQVELNRSITNLLVQPFAPKPSVMWSRGNELKWCTFLNNSFREDSNSCNCNQSTATSFVSSATMSVRF